MHTCSEIFEGCTSSEYYTSKLGNMLYYVKLCSKMDKCNDIILLSFWIV